MLLAKCEVANIGLHCYWLSVSDLTLQRSRVGSICMRSVWSQIFKSFIGLDFKELTDRTSLYCKSFQDNTTRL